MSSATTFAVGLRPDDCDNMEHGLCHEILSDEIYMPSHKSRKWVRCYFVPNGNTFW
jgi:hypothetical protein